MDEVRLRSDSIVARRIVASFLDFLRSVEVVNGVDPEGLEVAAQCLTEIFDPCGGSGEEISKFSLVDLVSQCDGKPDTKKSSNFPDAVDSQNVYQRFVEGLESAGFFSPSGGDNRMSQAESTFQETLKGFKGNDESELLAEAFKAQGNEAMAGHRYVEAIELYTLAISMSSNNAIYFANRAAAHTQTGNHTAAVTDCRRAIEINPRYSKAYSRLGLVYYSQGRYHDAIEWFSKALDVDPSNSSASENLESAKQKLVEAVCGSSQPFVNVIPESHASDSSAAKNSEAGNASEGQAQEQHQEQDRDRETQSSQSRSNASDVYADGFPELLRSVVQGIQQGNSGLEQVVPEVVQALGGLPEVNSMGSSTLDLSETIQTAIRNLGIPTRREQDQ